MIEIPLEGFLLTPVQKICKYPLQLKELLKYTHLDHPDYLNLEKALEMMKKTAILINETKRKMESLEKLAQWQTTIACWQVDSSLNIPLLCFKSSVNDRSLGRINRRSHLHRWNLICLKFKYSVSYFLGQLS